MHLQIVQDIPGTCPICGMALEPMTIALEEEENPELSEMTRRFWIGTTFTLPLAFITMTGAGAQIVDAASLPWLEWLLASGTVLWCGWPLLERAVQSLRNRSLNMFTLIGIGVIFSYAYSVMTILVPTLFPETLRNHGGEIGRYFETASTITVLVLLGQVLELRARGQTSSAIKALLGLAPKTARIVRSDGTEADISLEDVRHGDTIRIRPGEKVPVDGVLIEGRTTIDESMITGESIPGENQKDHRVIGGTLNGTGSVLMRAEKVGSETLLAHIVHLVSEAQRSRAPIQRLADAVSAYFVPSVIAISIITFFVWYAYGPEPSLAYAIVNAVAVLIIACPCALGLATPMSITVGIGKAASIGVLIRNAEALESMEKADTLVVDKTGTLTEGRPHVMAVRGKNGMTESEVLRLASGIERGSEHPLGAAILAEAHQRGIEPAKAQDVQSATGRGIHGTIEGRRITLGNELLLKESGIDSSSMENAAEQWRSAGQTVVFLAADKEVIGLLGVADPIKATTPEAIRLLRHEGMEVIMLTGDTLTTARAVGNALGLERVEAGVLPERKNDVIRKLQGEGHIVAMAGDGINDAPALAQAEIGIAMGTGTDIAMQSAGITLVKGDLMGIVRARHLSRAVMRNIRQNLFFAFFYNVLGVPVAAGILYPFTGMLLSPMIAAAAMSFSSVSVISNALRLRYVKVR